MTRFTILALMGAILGCGTSRDEGESGCEPSTEVCDGVDNDCDGESDEGCANDCTAGETRECGRAVGECAENLGTQFCDEATGTWDDCVGARQEGDVDEICDNNLDEDCDGAVDEGCPCESGVEQDCGPATDDGICEFGTQVCVGNAWSDCFEAVLPEPERCDEIDNDCDGATDNGFDLVEDVANCGSCGMVCAVPFGTPACEDGMCVVASCDTNFSDLDLAVANGCEYGPCLPSAGGLEQCDGIDNDCNGTVDDVDPATLAGDLANCGRCGTSCSFANASAVCTDGDCGIGSCNTGYYNHDGNPSNGCEYLCARTIPVAEVCNSEDDDCNGVADEGFDFMVDPSNCGFCSRTCDAPNAVAVCTDGDCVFSSCEPGFVNVNGSELDGCEYACTPTGPEVCDAAMVDEDCNGSRNEGCGCVDGDVEFCGTTAGECEYGTQTCVGGLWNLCSGGTDPIEETCDGDDNDCDELADEDFDLASDPANCGECGNACSFLSATALCDVGLCTMGTCETAFYDLDGDDANGCEYGPCVPTAGGIEQCDSIDNDCNGLVDEPCDCVDGASMACGPVSDEGVCAFGEQFCSGGAWGPCFGAVFPAPEVCDGADNDCDGFVDDGVLETFYADADSDGYGDPDVSSEACTAPPGSVANSLDCDDGNADVNPAEAEVCENGLDDDCSDGDAVCPPPPPPPPDTDGDGDPDVSDCNDADPTIFVGAPEVCGDGIDQNCDSVDPACPPPPPPPPDADGDGAPDAVDCAPADPLIYPGAPEVCNFVDDNCDGVVDNCLPSVGTIACTDTGSGLDVTVNGGISTGLIDPVPPSEVIMTIEIGADLDDCWNEAVSCFPTAYVGDGVDHLFSFGYTRFTPRVRTDLGTVRYFDLREWMASGDCVVEYDGVGGLRLNGLP